MGVKYEIVLASESDSDTVRRIIEDASSWLATLGTDQWQYPPNMDRIHGAIAAETLYLVREIPQGTPVGTITLSANADPDFWESFDDPSAALYVNRMAVVRARAGKGIGALMLNWASSQAKRQGKRWLRLDVWRSNTRLQDYYRSQGFELVRVVVKPWRKSGALFQCEV